MLSMCELDREYGETMNKITLNRIKALEIKTIDCEFYRVEEFSGNDTVTVTNTKQNFHNERMLREEAEELIKGKRYFWLVLMRDEYKRNKKDEKE